MRLFQQWAAGLAAAAMTFGPTAALADFKDRVMNKEGYWGIDVDNGACAASMRVQDGSILTFRAVESGVTIAVFFAKPIRKGKQAQVQTEAYSFDFAPSFTEEGGTVFYDGDLDNRAIAALRLAKEVRVLVDGRLVHVATFENTGFDGALDALIACAKGEKGWWSQGAPAGKARADEPEVALNKEGYWSVTSGNEPGVCIALAKIDDDLSFMFMSIRGETSFGVLSKTTLKRGRKGVFETDAFRFEFKPRIEKDFLYADGVFDSQELFALRRAKGAVVSIDGRTVVDMVLENTGHAQVLTDVAACSNGESGWWGAGAKKG